MSFIKFKPIKKIIYLILLFVMFSTKAQSITTVPKISVSGEGTVKVTPNMMILSISAETIGDNVTKVKKDNDVIISKTLAFLKKMKIAQKDIKTQKLSLYPRYNYEKKKNYNVAVQSINITLRDLSVYEKIMEGLIDSGINRLNGITYESSKIEILKTESRKLAMLDAKKKAEDLAGALGQKVGKAISISDNSNYHYERPVELSLKNRSEMLAMDSSSDEPTQKTTISEGEIDIKSSVDVTFILE